MRILALLLLPLLALTSGCSVSEGANRRDDPKPIPARERERENPIPAFEESIAFGKLIFSSQCTMCHGKNGDGKGDLVERLGLQVPDFRTEERRPKRSDGELFYIITHGHKRMPGDEKKQLSEETRWHLVNYVRSLSQHRE